MNRLLGCFIITIFSNCVTAQKTIVSDKLSYKLPKSAESISATSRLKPDKPDKYSIIQTNNKSGTAFQIDDISFLVHSSEGTLLKNFLPDLRKSLNYDKQMSSSTYKIQEITKLNNFSYLLYTYKFSTSNKEYLMLFAVDDSYTKVLSAVAEYDEHDSTKAEKIVNDFIKSIKFK